MKELNLHSNDNIINFKDDDGQNALFYAVKENQIETALYLIYKGISPLLTDNN